MPKRRAASRRTEIVLDQQAAAPLYKQLYQRLRKAILSEQLEAGARLPSTRTLASELGVSRNTTAMAYQQLLLEGFIESRVGDGTRVARLAVMPTPQRRGAQDEPRPPGTEAATAGFSRRGALLWQTPYLNDSDEIDSPARLSAFRAGQPDLDQFPYELWARLVARRARKSLRTAAGYQGAPGYYPLREAIAARIGITRGVYCSPEQVIVTAGSQGALDLAARVLLDPGDPAWIEDPGYLGARGALLGAGAKLVPVPVDLEGMDVETGRQISREAKLASVTPSHQFPTGVTMSLRRRLTLLDWARDVGAWILEDDYDSEYRFSGRPLEALQGLDHSGRVLYIGTFSKVLFPALRLGYLIVPAKMVEGFLAARRFIDVHVPLLEQMALSDFLAEGHFARHLRRMRRLYVERRETLIDELQRTLGDILDIAVPEAGMHLVAWLPPGDDDRTVAVQAAACGLEVAAISRFSLQPKERGGLILGYSGASRAELRAAVRKLATVIRSSRLSVSHRSSSDSR
ncbi:MAG: PLP-dependent aminotransferase family protein [Ktedonobacterales bacterium]